MSMQQLSVFLENKPGALGEFAKDLSRYHINMRALSIAESRDFGIIRVIVDDPYEATRILRENGYIVQPTPVVGAEVSDEPGALLHILETLSEKNINVDYTYAFVSQKKNTAYMILRTNDIPGTEKVLGKSGVTLIGQDEIVDDED